MVGTGFGVLCRVTFEVPMGARAPRLRIGHVQSRQRGPAGAEATSEEI